MITEALRRDLAPTSLTFGEKGGMFLQDPHAITPVLPVEVTPDSVPGPRQSWAPGEVAGALVCDLWKTDVKDMWDVLPLTDQ